MFAGWQLVHLYKLRKTINIQTKHLTYMLPNPCIHIKSSKPTNFVQWNHYYSLKMYYAKIAPTCDFEINFRHHPLLPIKMLNPTRSHVDKAWRVSRPCHAQLTRLPVYQTTGWQVSTVFTHGERTESLRARVGVPPFEAVRGLLAPACSSKTQPNPPDPPFPSLYLSSEETTRRYVRKCRASKRLRSYS